jgi:hypothetical protein
LTSGILKVVQAKWDDMCEPVDDNSVARNMLRDLLPCPEFGHVAEALGYVPASMEVERAEHVQSHMRRDRIEPIAPVIVAVASDAGRLAHSLAELSFPDLPLEAVEGYQNLARVSALAVISQLVDHGYLKVQV